MAVVLSSATPARAYDAALGKEVFEGNCATCHSGGKNVLIPSKTLAKADIEQYLDGGYNLTAIIKQVCTVLVTALLAIVLALISPLLSHE